MFVLQDTVEQDSGDVEPSVGGGEPLLSHQRIAVLPRSTRSSVKVSSNVREQVPEA